MQTLEQPRQAIERADIEVTRAAERQGPTFLRLALALVFLWFGALKLRPGGNAIEDLAGDTIHRLTLGRVHPRRAVFALGVVECGVGLGMLSRRTVRPALVVMAFHLLGTSSPLAVFPRRCFDRPWAPTVEGQYIVKNTVLAAAGFELLSRSQRAHGRGDGRSGEAGSR